MHYRAGSVMSALLFEILYELLGPAMNVEKRRRGVVNDRFIEVHTVKIKIRRRRVVLVCDVHENMRVFSAVFCIRLPYRLQIFLYQSPLLILIIHPTHKQRTETHPTE